MLLRGGWGARSLCRGRAGPPGTRGARFPCRGAMGCPPFAQGAAWGPGIAPAGPPDGGGPRYFFAGVFADFLAGAFVVVPFAPFVLVVGFALAADFLAGVAFFSTFGGSGGGGGGSGT